MSILALVFSIWFLIYTPKWAYKFSRFINDMFLLPEEEFKKKYLDKK